MSAASAKPKQTSRWGSLLSGAVAGLESRLDTFFEEGEGPNGIKKTATPPPASTPSKPSDASGISSPALRPDGATSSVVQDTSIRLSSDSLRASPLLPSQNPSSRASLDSTAIPPAEDVVFVAASLPSYASNEAAVDFKDSQQQGDAIPTFVSGNRLSLDKSNSPASSSRPSLDLPEIREPRDVEEPGDETAKEYLARIAQLQADNEAAELARQEEVHAYLERIDALQAKLQYLAKEAAETARQGIADTSNDAMQRKLAAKDEQIALLMEEGQKLSKAEVTQAGVARKLRIKVAEDGRLLADVKRKSVASEKLADDLSGKMRRLEANQRDAIAKLARIPQLERELGSIKSSRDEHASTIQVLRSQLDNESKRNQDAEVKANSAALEQQRKANQSLQEDLANSKIERQLAEDRLRNELRTSKEELEREKERGMGAELQMRNEINALEGRIESIRARNEEASSATTGDSRAKLMRQIEIMQSQYSLASENWQGIESSLQARLAAVEKERNDTARGEAEARKRAREASNSVRRLQEQLDESIRKSTILEQELSERQNHAEKLDVRAKELERIIKEANSNMERERSSWDLKLASRIEEEKAKWRQEFSSYSAEPSLAPDSPALYRKPSHYDLPTIATRRPIGRQFSSADLGLPMFADRRRTSYGKRHDAMSPNGNESGRSTPGLNGKPPHIESIHTGEPEDDNFDNDSSPHRTLNDMISVSTAGAGPSVQLVERMSSAVRRLESEKAAMKDEHARLVAQRDEARKEVVALMAETEEKRTLETKVKKMEEDMQGMEQRYQTTLEMMGEKSERVEELENDILDLKKIYRELVETMK